MQIEKLVRLFDLYFTDTQGSEYCPADDSSIAKIEAELECRLPEDLLWMSVNSPNFSKWFASLGSDYENSNHILNVNRLFREQESEGSGIPPWFIMVNLGFDDNCSGFDRRAPSSDGLNIYTCDYLTASTFVPSNPETFLEYLERQITFWLKDCDSDKQAKIKDIVG